MVGGALVRRFQKEPGVSLVLRGRKELDLTNQAAVNAFYAAEKPDTVIMAMLIPTRSNTVFSASRLITGSPARKARWRRHSRWPPGKCRAQSVRRKPGRTCPPAWRTA